MKIIVFGIFLSLSVSFFSLGMEHLSSQRAALEETAYVAKVFEKISLDPQRYATQDTLIYSNFFSQPFRISFLGLAAYHGQTALCEKLLKHEANISYKIKEGHFAGYTPLQLAMHNIYGSKSKGNIKQTIKALIKHGAGLNDDKLANEIALDLAREEKQRLATLVRTKSCYNAPEKEMLGLFEDQRQVNEIISLLEK